MVPAQRNVHKGHTCTQPRKYVWKVQDNNFDGDFPPFLGERRVNVDGREPIDFFRYLFPLDLIDVIVHNTNMYALQKGKENLAVTSEEMQIFLGINMVMGYIRYPRTRMYWSSEEGLRLGIIADAMSVNRYEQILRHLHFVDNYTHQPANTDRLFKLAPVLNTLQKTFLMAANPEEFQSIDEQIIPFKGQLSIKQYIPKKPKPWGVKVWVRAGSSGYMYKFEIYQGSAIRGQSSSLGMAGDVVMRLCDDIKHKNHKVFFDNFFCSIPLLEALKDLGIYGTGTCRTNRLKGASQKLKSEKQLKKEGRGACSVVSTNSNITVTRWLDSSVIHMASTCAGQSPEDTAQRWLKKEQAKISVQRPYSVALYNQHMGGVDLVDQCVAMYPHRRRNKRWYIRVFFHFLDVTVVNAWRLYLMSGLEKMNLLIFKASVARALINSGSGQQKRKGRPSGAPPPAKCRAVTKVPSEVRFSAGNHWPELTQVKNANRCHNAACTRKTKYICMQCHVALCPGCFANFHVA
ncbi:piggyBac transposable element-derived protein 2-like [Xiphophorus couchianus]|uniref:piggyBac transposable element-derived protein 2-like n=1 Tax=Xiphophorus couchianus TaxID=32473 RepID=UPI001016F40B|nr:piggyBac transposable element-derived protein 2-like [Xiphophorus couchianus]